MRYKIQVDSNGYSRTRQTGHPNADVNGYVYVHRLVMEAAIGRYLETNEHVHHRNGLRADNRLANLELLTATEHKRRHMPTGPKVKSLLHEQRIVELRNCGSLVKEIKQAIGLDTATITKILARHPIACSQCGREFSQQKGLGMHIRRAHR